MFRDAPPLPEAPAPDRRVERRTSLPSSRAVVGGLLMALAAIGAFLGATAGGDDRIGVLVATRDLTPGEVLSPDDVAMVRVGLPDEVRGLFGTVDAATGRQLVAPVGAGELLLASATTVATSGDEHLELTIGLPAGRAAGRLQPGERVDVFSTWSGEVTELIAVDARVVEVLAAADATLGGAGAVQVRLALSDLGQVEALVHAQAAGDLTLVRAAIGTEVGDLGRRYRPLLGSTGPVSPSTAPPPAESPASDEPTADDAGDEP